MTTATRPAGDKPALRAALAQVDQTTRPADERPVLTPEDIPGHVLFWRIAIQPYVAKYDGRIETPEMTKRAEEVASCCGQILAIGSMAFKSRTVAGLVLSDEPHLPKVGDFVLHEPYAGTAHKLKGRGERVVRLMNDTDVMMVVDSPDQLRGYL